MSTPPLETADPTPPERSPRLLRRILFAMAVVAAALVGVIVGQLLVYSVDLPQVNDLESYRPSTITELYDIHGNVIGSFALQRRVVARYQDYPRVLREAVISIEDKDFEKHSGVDVWRIFGAAWKDLIRGRRAQGASTLTMQLSRDLFLSPERTFSRKIQEAMLAIQIERHFTKAQIFTLYANQIFLGHGVYGFEAGSEFYFSKPAKDLTLDEAALLAGLPKAPSAYSPISNPARALRRRNLVINNMLEDGKITAEEATIAKSRPIVLKLQSEPNIQAPYFVEDVRQYLEKKYGPDEVHKGGLRVYTTLDLNLQRVATRAVRDGLAAYERSRGWKGHLENVIANGEKLDNYRHPDWDRKPQPGDYFHALVTRVTPAAAEIRLGSYHGEIHPAEMAWTRHRSPAEILKTGDVVYVQVTALGPGKKSLRLSLQQDSGVQGALVAIDNDTGEVRAMVGGRDFAESKFNRATQALRQTGSSFKPYVYAAAVEGGAEPDDTIVDAPISFTSASGTWTPHNYDHRFEGRITLLHALADSRNIPAVKLAERVGIRKVIDYAHKFGITSEIPPYLPVALGAAEVTLLQHTAAYSTFPNDGVLISPHMIRKVTDYNGRVLEADYADARDVISAHTARVMVGMLRDVIQHGTGRRASKLNYPLGGKTGTTNDFTDAWFMGFSPSVTCGVWTGYDEKKSLGNRETGARVALPIWMEFMKAAIAGKKNEHFPAAPPAVAAGQTVAANSAAASSAASSGDVASGNTASGNRISGNTDAKAH